MLGEWGEVSPQCNAWRVSWGISSVQWWLSGAVSIKSEEDGGVPTRVIMDLSMRSPSSLDLPYTRSQAWGGALVSFHGKRAATPHQSKMELGMSYLMEMARSHERREDSGRSKGEFQEELVLPWGWWNNIVWGIQVTSQSSHSSPKQKGSFPVLNFNSSFSIISSNSLGILVFLDGNISSNLWGILVLLRRSISMNWLSYVTW